MLNQLVYRKEANGAQYFFTFLRLERFKIKYVVLYKIKELIVHSLAKLDQTVLSFNLVASDKVIL